MTSANRRKARDFAGIRKIGNGILKAKRFSCGSGLSLSKFTGFDPVRVIAAIVLYQNKILAAQRPKGALAGFWEFPGGKQEPGETDQQTLLRELQEELGISVKIISKLGEFPYRLQNRSLDFVVFVTQASDPKFTIHEHQDARWVSFDELKVLELTPAALSVLPYLDNWLKKRRIF